MTTADAVANKARIQRGDKANEVDEALNGGAPAFHTAMAKQGAMHGIAVGGCCELSTSAHHLVAKIGEEQGYRLAESSGMDIEDAITIATRLLKGRIAKQVWRDYHKHAFARRCYADPSDMGLKALQLSDRRREQDQTEREQLQLQHMIGGVSNGHFPQGGGRLAGPTDIAHCPITDSGLGGGRFTRIRQKPESRKASMLRCFTLWLRCGFSTA